MRGWLRRTPILGVTLVAIVVATLGWPGAAVYEARASLIRLALPGSLGFLGAAAMLLSITYYGRLLVIGVMTPDDAVREVHGEEPRWGRTRRRVVAAVVVDAVEAAPTAPAPAEATAEVVAGGEAVPEAAPARKRRSPDAAAEEPLPTVAAEAVQLELIAGIEAAAAAEATLGESTSVGATIAAGTTRLGLRRHIVLAWRLNRTLEVSFVVAAGAALAVAVAFGGLGARGASQSGIPLDAAAHATPTPSPVPTVAPTPTPTPSGSAEPSPLTSDSPQPGASGSPNGSAIPSASPAPTPVKTAAPLRTIGS
jgi:hypothetical protein